MTSCECSAHGSFLTAKGLAEAAQQFSLEGLAPRGEREYLDKVGSVSALVEVEVMEDLTYDPAHIELNQRLIHQDVGGSPKEGT